MSLRKLLIESFLIVLFISNVGCENKKEFNTVTRCVEEITETGSTCSQEWRITDIDSTKANPDIAIDSGNNIHIVFDRKYVTNVSGNWQKFIVFSEDFKVLNPTIVIDSGGNKHIFAVEYIDDEPRRLQHAKGELGNWNISIIDLGEDVRWYSANLDSKDNIHIVYSGLSGGVSYATNLSGQWEKYFIDEGNFWYILMDSVVDQKDNIHIAYLDRDLYLSYATNSTGKWGKYLLDKGYCCEDGFLGPSFAAPSIAIDTESHIYINYLSEKYSEYNQPLIDYRYITNASGKWESHSLPYGDFNMPMVIDTHGALHIAYAGGNIVYGTNLSGEWKYYIIEKAEKPFQWSHVAIAKDSQDNIHIVYSGEDGTKYATMQP